MATFITLTDKVTLESIAAIKTPQCRELLSFLFHSYGVNNPINNSDLLLELNTHQHDGLVFKKGSAGPISRIYEFYRKRGLEDPGYITVTKPATKKQTTETLQLQYDMLIDKIAALIDDDDLAAILEEISEAVS